ncbi:MAG TPA: hypothetical protein VFL04_00390 [Rectinemataceae bacterium]|nr:hypothetical protein [Rectinemataceae bacterium]
MAKPKDVIHLVVTQLDECFAGPAWHGASLYPTLAELDLAQAWYESAEGLSAWKVALHCAYWKWRVRKVLLAASGQSISRFGRSPADWPRLPKTLDAANWKADLGFLEDHHAALRAAVVEIPASLLWESYDSKGRIYHRLIAGAASHDAYHTAHVRNIGIPGLI